MAITLTQRFLTELKNGVNQPNVIIEISLDSGTVNFGYHGRNGSSITGFPADGTYLSDGSVFATGTNELEPFGIVAALKSVSSLQNKLDPKTGYSTRGALTVVITGRDNFKNLIRDNYLKNRRVTRKDGFISPGFSFPDYAATFTGRITDWTRKGDDLTLTVSDDLINAVKKVPVENSTKTQRLDYRNTNPVDIMTDLLLNKLGIEAPYVDVAKFSNERDMWLSGWRFDRVITEPKEANEYLNELQLETNSFLIHDGEKISFKVFSPPIPGQAVEEWTDNCQILADSFTQKSGYKDNFCNRVVIYYDYDESGSDNEENFESAVIIADASSQAASQWNEASEKTIKSRWLRSFTYTQPVSITGVTIYHCSRNNGAGQGILTFTFDAAAGNKLQWSAPGDGAGPAVTVTKNGKFQIHSADKTRWIRVLVEVSSLPVSGRGELIAISTLNGEQCVTALANKILSRYRNPAASVSFDVDINNSAYNTQFIKPADIKDITTDEACGKGENSWIRKRVMLTSVKPDFSGHKVAIEALDARIYRRYGFIAPAGYPDYGAAADTQKEYGYIGDTSNKVGAGTVDGYCCW